MSAEKFTIQLSICTVAPAKPTKEIFTPRDQATTLTKTKPKIKNSNTAPAGERLPLFFVNQSDRIAIRQSSIKRLKL